MAGAAPLRVALLADTHGALDPRVVALADTCDRVVHAGDVGAADILERLRRPAGPPIAVAGNNDTRRHWPAGQEAVLDGLPEEAELALPGGRLVVIHGHRQRARDRHRRLRARFPDAAAVVCGHSHREAIDTADSPWVLNPGAAGRSRAHGGPGCLVLTADPAGWSVASHRFQRR